jgi:hypothetical protein
MPPLLQSLFFATALSYVLASVPGGFEEGGSTLVSAMMVSQRSSAVSTRSHRTLDVPW